MIFPDWTPEYIANNYGIKPVVVSASCCGVQVTLDKAYVKKGVIGYTFSTPPEHKWTCEHKVRPNAFIGIETERIR